MNGQDVFNWLDNETQEKMLSRGVSGDDLLALLNVKHEIAMHHNYNPPENNETTNPEEMKRKYDHLLQHQQELETRIQSLVQIIINEEQPLPQPDLNFNYDDMASQFSEILMQRPAKRVRGNHTSPMDTSPITPVHAVQQPIQPMQHTQTMPNPMQQQHQLTVQRPSPQQAPLMFSQDRRQQFQNQQLQQHNESILTNFSPQLQVDPFWQMNFLNTPTGLGPTNGNGNTGSNMSTPTGINVLDEFSVPISRKRSNSEPGFGLLAFQQQQLSNGNGHHTSKSLTPNSVNLPTPSGAHPRRKRSNSDAVVFVDEISKSRETNASKEPKQSAADKKKLVEQQGGYNRDKKKRKYDNMMTFFKFR